jgi:uncharacterized protein YgiM (DUF1202 family)
MQARKIFLSVTIMILLSNVSLAQRPAAVLPPDKPDEVKLPAVPYVAEITGANINIRSGPGTNYYRCGKLNKPGRVTVVGHKSGWSQIIPPRGSFSWISKQYVKVDLNNPNLGVVTGDEVRVWAGSGYVEPIHSSSLQTKLNIGNKVRLMGEEKSGYYKIVPPEGAYLWVSTQYTRYLNALDETRTEEPQPIIESETEIITQPEPQRRVVSPVTSQLEDEKLKEYYNLEKQIEAEQVKPIIEQDYSRIKEALARIVNQPDSGKAGRYAKFQIERIGRFEIARRASEKIQEQDKHLAQIREQIRQAGQARLAQVKDLGRFTVVGQLRPSQIYTVQTGPKRYLLLDKEQKALCYAQPAGEIQAIDLSEFKDCKVGLVGRIETDSQSNVPLVKFDQIERIEP